MILTFTQYLEPVTFKSGKTGPARWKAGGTDYLLAKGIEITLNTPYECVVDTTHSIDGKFTNYTVRSAVALPAGPVSPPISTPTPTPRQPVEPHKEPAVSLTDSEIAARVNCLKAAIECMGALPRDVPEKERGRLADLYAKNIVETAELFVAWVFKEEVHGLSGNEGGGQTVGTEPAPITRDLDPDEIPW